MNGQDRGLALIPSELWPEMARSDVWLTGRFRFASNGEADKPVSTSAYDVRVDRDPRTLPERAPSPPTPSRKATGTGKRAGRPSGTNGEPIARLVKRLLLLPADELAAFKVEALTSELVAEYRALDLPAPHEDNARRDARGILRALREAG